jgi:hypothetical protein
MSRALASLLTLILLVAPGLIQAGTPIISANGNSTSITVSAADPVTISIGMTDAITDPVADWWIAVTTQFAAPDDLYFFDGSGWGKQPVVAFQQAFSNFTELEILAITALPVGVYTFYFAVELNLNGVLDMESLVYASVQVSVEPAVAPSTGSCGTDKAVFTVSPLQSNAFFEIDPLGAINPSAHTFPTVHTYMMLSDNSVVREVFAPGNITLTQVNAVENLSTGGTDFSVNFSPCPEITGYFDHMHKLTDPTR